MISDFLYIQTAMPKHPLSFQNDAIVYHLQGGEMSYLYHIIIQRLRRDVHATGIFLDCMDVSVVTLKHLTELDKRAMHIVSGLELHVIFPPPHPLHLNKKQFYKIAQRFHMGEGTCLRQFLPYLRYYV